MKRLINKIKSIFYLKKIDKKVNKLFGKRKSRFVRTILNIVFFSVYYLQYIVYIGLIAGLGVFLFSFKDKFIAEVDHGTVLSFALTFYGFLVSIFAVLLSRESEKILSKRFLNIVLNHSYIVHNSYSIIGIPTIFLFFSLWYYFNDKETTIALSLVVILSSIVSIIFMMISIVRNKTKILLSYYLPLHRARLFDSVITLKKSINEYVSNSAVNEKWIELVIKKNKYIKGYDRALSEVCAFFRKDVSIDDVDIQFTNQLIKKFRINQYDYDSMAYISKISKSVSIILEQLIKRGEYKKSLNIVFNYLEKIDEILESKEVKQLFADIQHSPFTDREIALSSRLLEQVKGQNLFSASLVSSLKHILDTVVKHTTKSLKNNEKQCLSTIIGKQGVLLDKMKSLSNISDSDIDRIEEAANNYFDKE